jgi:hypothetical protein
MTPDRCSERPKVKRPPDRGTAACVAKALSVPTQRSIGLNRDALIDLRTSARRGWLPALVRTFQTETDQEAGRIQRP